MKKYILILVVLSLSSCASYFKRKECDATNWFDYGQSVALDGRRLTGDQFILECNKAEADVDDSALDRGFKAGLEKYCQPDTVYQIGKNGSFFSTEMCVGENLTTLKNKHKLGVLDYCAKANGYAAGAKGKPYNKICPADLEVAFVPEFNRGRKKYLNTVISENEKQINQLEQDISKLQTNIRYKRSELQRYQIMASNNPQDSAAMSGMSGLNGEINNLTFTVNSKTREQDNLRNKNRELKLEVVQLDN